MALTALDPCAALGVAGGLVAVAGAGGKKSTLYALARAFPGRLAVTASVNCPPPPPDAGLRLVVAESAALPAQVRAVAPAHSRVFFAAPGKRADLLGGVAPATIAEIHAAGLFDLVLVKADGARRRLIKAPGAGEPVYPPGTTRVLYLVSAHALGRRADSGVAHRLEELTAVTGVAAGGVLAPEHLVRLLSSEAGALKGLAPATPLVAVLNRVDTAERYRQARAVAARTLAASDRVGAVVLARMGEEPPLLEVVARD